MNFFRKIAFVSLLPLAAGAADLSLNGAGASFPAPVYRAWTYGFSQSTGKRVEVNYQSSGSGAGINQIKDGTIDFGGTDNPLTRKELDAANLCQFPMLTGGVGNIIGTFFGVLSLSTIKNIVSSLGLDEAWWTNITVAGMICLFIVIQSLVLSRKNKDS